MTVLTEVSMTKDQDLISTTELANLLGVSRVNIFNKIKKREIEATKVGRSYVISRKSMPWLFGETSPAAKQTIEAAVKKIITEYGDVLKLLGKE